MKITWQDRVYDLDPLEVTLEQSDTICLFTGVQTLDEWERALADPRSPKWPKAVGGAWWLMQLQSGEDCKIHDAVKLPYLKFGSVLADAYLAEAQAAGMVEADPTKLADPSGGMSKDQPDPGSDG